MEVVLCCMWIASADFQSASVRTFDEAGGQDARAPSKERAFGPQINSLSKEGESLNNLVLQGTRRAPR